jgi:cytohesin
MRLLITARSEGGDGQDVSARARYDQTALHFAAQGGHVEAIRLLVDKHAEIDAIDADGATALHSAAALGRTNAITDLIWLGADVGAQDSSGCTGLHYAAQEGHAATIDLLVQEGCDVNAQMYKMKGSQQSLWTPLHLAVCNGHMDALRQLLTASVDVKITDSEGSTALHYASTVRSLVMQGGIELLVAAGAKVNAQGEDGYTPLHYAADLGHKDALQRLLDVGADPTMVALDELGSDATACDCAINGGHDECALLLERLWDD